MEHNEKKIVRLFDVLLIVIILLGSLIPVGIFSWQQLQMPADGTIVAVILINGIEVDRFELREDKQSLTTYTSEHGLLDHQYNVVEIDGLRIRVQRDNSPDQVGVNRGWVSRPGQTIVVLPHRFLIRLITTNYDESEIIVPF